MLKSQKMAITSLIVVFLFGIFCGIASERFVLSKVAHKHKRPKREPLSQKFKRELGLNTQQEETLIKLLKDVKSQHDAIRNATRPQYDSVRVDFRNKFNSILDDEQQEKYRIINEEWNKKRIEREERENNKKD